MISKSQAKYIQSLAQKKYRDEEGLFIAEGPKLVKELLQNETARPVQIYAVDDWIRGNEVLSQVDVIQMEAAGNKRPDFPGIGWYSGSGKPGNHSPHSRLVWHFRYYLQHGLCRC